MGRISIELVPRQKDKFIEELQIIKKHFPSVETINIPDIQRYEINSLEGARLGKKTFPSVIPHLRAVAVDKRQDIPYKKFLVDNEINEVLLVLGDEPVSESKDLRPCNTLELIKKFRKELPSVKVYAAIDQYRSSLKKEYEYVQRKIDAGACAFFTQPFFDLNLLQDYIEKLAGIDVFWGISPVITPKSKKYWEDNNKVRFPSDFSLTLESNRQFALDVLSIIKDVVHSHIYFMPIKTDFLEYLTGII